MQRTADVAQTALPAWQLNVLAAAAQHVVDMRGTSRHALAERDLEALVAMFTGGTDACELHEDQPADCPVCHDIEVDRGEQIDREIDELRLR